MDVIGFGFSAFLAHVLTNIDNLAIMSGLILTVGVWRTTVGYLVAGHFALRSGRGCRRFGKWRA
jgi:hypothetical protein